MSAASEWAQELGGRTYTEEGVRVCYYTARPDWGGKWRSCCWVKRLVELFRGEARVRVTRVELRRER